MERTNSKRLLFTANHVTTKLSDNDRDAAASQPQPEGALRKLAFVRALRVTSPELQRLSEQSAAHDPHLREALRAVGQVETAPHLEAAAGLARVPAQRLGQKAAAAPSPAAEAQSPRPTTSTTTFRFEIVAQAAFDFSRQQRARGLRRSRYTAARASVFIAAAPALAGALMTAPPRQTSPS